MQIPQYTQRVQKEFTPSTKATFNVPSALSDASHLGKQANIAGNAINVLGDMYQKMTDDRNLAIATEFSNKYSADSNQKILELKEKYSGGNAIHIRDEYKKWADDYYQNSIGFSQSNDDKTVYLENDAQIKTGKKYFDSQVTNSLNSLAYYEASELETFKKNQSTARIDGLSKQLSTELDLDNASNLVSSIKDLFSTQLAGQSQEYIDYSTNSVVSKALETNVATDIETNPIGAINKLISPFYKDNMDSVKRNKLIDVASKMTDKNAIIGMSKSNASGLLGALGGDSNALPVLKNNATEWGLLMSETKLDQNELSAVQNQYEKDLVSNMQIMLAGMDSETRRLIGSNMSSGKVVINGQEINARSLMNPSAYKSVMQYISDTNKYEDDLVKNNPLLTPSQKNEKIQAWENAYAGRDIARRDVFKVDKDGKVTGLSSDNIYGAFNYLDMMKQDLQSKYLTDAEYKKEFQEISPFIIANIGSAKSGVFSKNNMSVGVDVINQKLPNINNVEKMNLYADLTSAYKNANITLDGSDSIDTGKALAGQIVSKYEEDKYGLLRGEVENIVEGDTIVKVNDKGTRKAFGIPITGPLQTPIVWKNKDTGETITRYNYNGMNIDM